MYTPQLKKFSEVDSPYRDCDVILVNLWWQRSLLSQRVVNFINSHQPPYQVCWKRFSSVNLLDRNQSLFRGHIMSPKSLWPELTVTAGVNVAEGQDQNHRSFIIVVLCRRREGFVLNTRSQNPEHNKKRSLVIILRYLRNHNKQKLMSKMANL